MNRRRFLSTSGALASGLLFARGKVLAAPTEARVEILLDEPLGVISPAIYGHFTEHLGGAVYDGVWVGENAKVPNTSGIRTALMDKLRQIKASVIRWPGGCFADSYDWKDGIGPRAQRPTRTNFWVDDSDARRLNGKGVQLYEDNAFGTDEFIHFCKLSGAEPYLAANLRSQSALEFDHYVEYCNSPAGSTTLANIRAAGGSLAPFNVRHWGVGNESWGCGGNFDPEDYASEYRRFTAWVPRYGLDLRFIGSGPNGDDIAWTHRFFQKLTSGSGDRNNLWGWSLHHYAWNLSRGKTNDWLSGKGDALRFDLVDFYETLRQADRLEGMMLDHWSVLGEYDPQHRVKLVVDEYGPWYRQGTELDPTHLFGQQITMRDALVTALSLDTFNRHPDKVAMAACAQLINCLNALFFSHEEHFIVTPNFHVFDLYAAHQNGQGVRAEFGSASVSYLRDDHPVRFWGLKGSASLKEKTLTVTLVNPDIGSPRETEVLVLGAVATAANARTLSNPDMHAHNTFAQPEAVKPSDNRASLRNGGVTLVLPPASVTNVTLTLA